MVNNRIEEVKKILDKHKGEFICNGKYQDITNVTIAKEIDDYYCQLFPQPLDDKELREKIAIEFFKTDCPYGEWIYATELHKEKCLAKADQILALLQPKIEEAKKEERERIRSFFDEDEMPEFLKGGE